MNFTSKNYLCSLKNFKYVALSKSSNTTNILNKDIFPLKSRTLPEDLSVNPFLPEKLRTDLLSETLNQPLKSIDQSNIETNWTDDSSFDNNNIQIANDPILSENESLCYEYSSLNIKGKPHIPFVNETHNFSDLFELNFDEEDSTILKKRKSLSSFKTETVKKNVFTSEITNKMNYLHYQSKNKKLCVSSSEKLSESTLNDSTFSKNHILSFPKTILTKHKNENKEFILNNKQKAKIKKISLFWRNETKLIPSVFRNLKKIPENNQSIFEKQDLSHKELLGKQNI